MYEQNPYNNPMLLINRNKNYVHQFLCSPVILILGILQAAAAALSLFSSFLISAASKEFAGMLNELFASLNEAYPTEVNFTASDLSISIPVLPIILAVAFFLMYFSAKSKKDSNGAANGATILFITSILSVIGASLFALLFVILAIVMILAGSYLTGGSVVTAYGITNSADLAAAQSAISVVYILLIGFMALCVAWLFVSSISYLKFTSSIKKSLTTAELLAKGAKTYGVINVISAIFSGIGMVISIILFFAALFVSEISPLAILAGIYATSNLLSFIYTIFNAKFAFGYNKHIAAAGPNGMYLPMPVVEYAPAQTEPVYSVPTAEESTTTPEADTDQSTQSAEATTESPMHYCAGCGAPVAEGQRFCANCGRSV